MTSIILLGAGASFGSEAEGVVTPPLGRDLFAKLESAGGVAAELPDDLKELFRSNFEAGMARYRECVDDDAMRFQRELAHYLAQFRPGPNSVYIRLIKAIGVQRVIYCSLNYDLLFELSAAAMGFNTVYGTEKKKGYARLLKLHGSCNFWPDIPVGVIRGSTFKGGGRADIQAPIRPLSQEDTIYRCTHEDSLAPAIAMYAEGKPVNISPDYIEEQQAQWVKSLRLAKNVFVIGVRVHPVDKHIWSELLKTKANMIYFGFPSDRPDFSQWKSNSSKKNCFFVEADFRNSINTIKTRL